MKVVSEKLRYYSRVNLAGDVVILVSSFLAAYLIIWNKFRPDFPYYFTKVIVAILLCWGITSLVFRLYARAGFEKFRRTLPKHFLALLFNAVLLVPLIYFVCDFTVSRILFIYAYALFVVLDTLLLLAIGIVLRRT